jgi:IS1 family transposase
VALDEVVIKIAGVKHWLWGAVDQNGMVLDILVQNQRDTQAAKRLLRKLLKKQMRPPRVMITDKLVSYGAAKSELMPSVEHRRHKGLNNRAEKRNQQPLPSPPRSHLRRPISRCADPSLQDFLGRDHLSDRCRVTVGAPDLIASTTRGCPTT